MEIVNNSKSDDVIKPEEGGSKVICETEARYLPDKRSNFSLRFVPSKRKYEAKDLGVPNRIPPVRQTLKRLSAVVHQQKCLSVVNPETTMFAEHFDIGLVL